MADSRRKPREGRQWAFGAHREKRAMKLGLHVKLGSGRSSMQGQVLTFVATRSRELMAASKRSDVLTVVIRENPTGIMDASETKSSVRPFPL